MNPEQPEKTNAQRAKEALEEIKKILDGKEPDPEFLSNIDSKLDDRKTTHDPNQEAYENMPNETPTPKNEETPLAEKYKNANFKTGGEWRTESDETDDDK